MKPFAQQGNFTIVHNYIFDTLLHELTGSELKVLLAVVRATTGWDQPSAKMSYAELSDATGLARSTAIEGVKSLAERDLIVVYSTPGEANELALNRDYSVDDSPKIGHQGGTENATGVTKKIGLPSIYKQIKNNNDSGLDTDSETPPLMPGEMLTSVIRSYENNIGAISRHVSELIADACEEFGEQAVIDAIGIAAENNVRKWAYVDGILARWRVHGRQEKKAVHTPEQSEDGGYYV